MKPWLLIAIPVALLLTGLTTLYLKDAKTVEQALVVEQFFQNYCRQHGSYPEPESLEASFPELYPDQEWYYWPNETRTIASFQYPMLLPLPSAPGRSKLSEFIPIIYSFAVRHPCEGIL